MVDNKSNILTGEHEILNHRDNFDRLCKRRDS